MRLFFQVLSFWWAVVIVPVATVLAFVSFTWSGRVFAVMAIGVGVAPFLVSLAHVLAKPKLRRLAGGLLVLASVTYAALAISRPNPGNYSRVRRLVPTSTGWLACLAPTRVLPERDQLALGYFLTVPMDPLFTFRQALQLRRLTADVYREMDGDDAFRRLPTALPDAYASLWSPTPANGDGFLYIPRSVNPHTPAPVLVFLHGSGGNFKGYLWILSHAADATGSILIAPSCGVGDWQFLATEQVIAKALARARSFAALDERRMTIVGLSNGGRGVCQSLVATPAQWSSVVLISPVFDDTALTRSDAHAFSGKPMLVISGGEDDRVPIDYVRTSASQLVRDGARVTTIEMPAADHFLIFSHRREVADEIARWLQRH